MFQRDEALALSLAGVIAFLVVAFAVFAGVVTPASERAARSGQPACSEWTDGCIVCARRPEGLACSTPGIACTRSAPRCLRP
jgi:hypothetical protein